MASLQHPSSPLITPCTTRCSGSQSPKTRPVYFALRAYSVSTDICCMQKSALYGNGGVKTALNNNSLEKKSLLTYSWPSCSQSHKWEVPLQIHAEISPFPGPLENIKCIKSEITSFPFCSWICRTHPLCLWECVNESSCDPGSLLTTSVTLCSVPQPPDLHFKQTKQFCYSRNSTHYRALHSQQSVSSSAPRADGKSVVLYKWYSTCWWC